MSQTVSVVTCQAENDKKVKDEQIGQLREEIAHQEELISKLNREKKSIGESKLKEEEQVRQIDHLISSRRFEDLQCQE